MNQRKSHNDSDSTADQVLSPFRSPRRLKAWHLLSMVILALVPSVGASGTEIEAVTRFGIDSYGHRTHVESPFGATRTYTFNHQGYERTVDYDGATVITDTVFGASGLVESYRYTTAPIGKPIGEERMASFEYDALERLTRIGLATDGLSGFDYQAKDLEYDERGFLSTQTRADRSVGSASIHYDYNTEGQLSRLDWNGQVIDYSYDGRGNMIGRSDRLGVPGLSLAIDTYGLDNRRADWTYDDAGRVLTDDRNRYEYDASGRIRLVRDLDTGTWKAHYLYDADGRRIRTLEPDRVTYSYRDVGGAVIAEEVLDRALESTVLKEHVLFGGKKVMQATYEGDAGAEIELQFNDRLGNPVAIWGADDAQTHEYSPYGHAMAIGAAMPHAGAHGFVGHEDDSTGLTYMQARFYDADTARFNRPDPARDFDLFLTTSFNLYQYTRGNPIAFVDSSGMSSDDPTDLGSNLAWAIKDAWFNPPTYAKNMRRAGFGVLMTYLGLKAVHSGAAGFHTAWTRYMATRKSGTEVANAVYTSTVNSAWRKIYLGTFGVGYGTMKVGESIAGGNTNNYSIVRYAFMQLGFSYQTAAGAELLLDGFINAKLASNHWQNLIWIGEFVLTGFYDAEATSDESESDAEDSSVIVTLLSFEEFKEEQPEPEEK